MRSTDKEILFYVVRDDPTNKGDRRDMREDFWSSRGFYFSTGFECVGLQNTRSGTVHGAGSVEKRLLNGGGTVRKQFYHQEFETYVTLMESEQFWVCRPRVETVKTESLNPILVYYTYRLFKGPLRILPRLRS